MKDENTFNHFDPDARVWIYQSGRAITEAEVSVIEAELQNFCRQWQAHGAKLAAAGSVLYNRFIVLVVDEKAEAASGCSIDTSVHLVKKLGERLGIDFFDRLQVIYVNDNNQLAGFHSSDTMELLAEGRIHEGTPVFNNMVQTLGELRDHWHQPMKDTWLTRYL